MERSEKIASDVSLASHENALFPQDGVLLCGHGSRDSAAAAEFAALAGLVAQRLPGALQPLAYGFLEAASPSLPEGVALLHGAGVTRILAIPALLFAAGHVRRDIPECLRACQAGVPGLDIRYGRELGVDGRMVRAVMERIKAALGPARSTPQERRESALLVVGRGTTEAGPTAGVERMARLVLENGGFASVDVAWAGARSPPVSEALEQVLARGARRVVIVPYLLFGGVLMERIRSAVASVAARAPQGDLVLVPSLGPHPLVAETLAARVLELLGPDAGPPPEALCVGVGCESGTDAEEVLALIHRTLGCSGCDPARIVTLATLERKARDPALLAAAAALGVPLRAFSAPRLEEETPRLATPSAAIFRAVGCHGVAEAAALAAAGPGAVLAVAKRKSRGATCAVALG